MRKTVAAKPVAVQSIDVAKSANAAGATANQKAVARVNARIIGMSIPVSKAKPADSTSGPGDSEPGQSTAMPEDPFSALSSKGQALEPPFDMLTLAMLPEHNSELGQCIEAMEVNIEGFGHRYIPRVRIPEADSGSELAQQVKQERVHLENFFAYCTQESYTQFRRKLRRDLETTGNGYFEVIRNAAGAIQSFTHIPAYQIRLGRVDEDPIEVERPIVELQIDNSVKLTKITEWRRFRKFIQSKSSYRRNLTLLNTGKVRWFKEFGDPRVYNNRTGEEVTDAKAIEALPIAQRANEVVHTRIYSARSPYGLPRYIGNLLSIFGDRAAEEINYVTFRNNNIPSMVVCVSNGQLTEGSFQRITDFVESQIQGSDNYSKFLLLEAEGLVEGEDGSQAKLDIKPLVKDQHKDALFQNYSSNNQDKIRRAFRLPPIFVGRAEDYTRATAEASRRLADEQIFSPERDEFDNLMNRIIFPSMGFIYHKFKSNNPNTTDNAELVKILAGAEKTGGMTPRIARDMLEVILGRDLPEFPKEFASDVPFSLTMAEAVKNMADPAEPGQQVTALKVLKALGIGDDAGVDEVDQDLMVSFLVKMNAKMEKMWQQQAASAMSPDAADNE